MTDMTPAAIAPDPLANMDADDLRAVVRQMRQQMASKDADIADLRGKLAESDATAKAAVGEKFRVQRDLDSERKKTGTLTSLLDTVRTRVAQLGREIAIHEDTARTRKAEQDDYKQRAEAAEQRVAELTAPKPDGYIIAHNVTEAELDAFAEQGRKVSHLQFMPDFTLNAVIEPCSTQPHSRYQRNQSAYTPTSGLPIPPIGRRVPPPVPAHNAPRPSSSHPVSLSPTAITMTGGQAARVPTFPEILSARTSGQITADQFTRYANALAGHNAAQRTMESH